MHNSMHNCATLLNGRRRRRGGSFFAVAWTTPEPLLHRSIHPSDKHARSPARSLSPLAVGEGVTSKVENLFMSLARSLARPLARSLNSLCGGSEISGEIEWSQRDRKCGLEPHFGLELLG